MGLECEVFMGEEDTIRQALNVFRMELLGAKVTAVKTGTRTLKDAVNAALQDCTRTVGDTFYCIGSVMGPHPYPEMVRDFQSIIGREIKAQIQDKEGRFPDAIIACVGGGEIYMSNIQAAFDMRKAEGRKAFIPFISLIWFIFSVRV